LLRAFNYCLTKRWQEKWNQIQLLNDPTISSLIQINLLLKSQNDGHAFFFVDYWAESTKQTSSKQTLTQNKPNTTPQNKTNNN